MSYNNTNIYQGLSKNFISIYDKKMIQWIIKNGKNNVQNAQICVQRAPNIQYKRIIMDY